MPPKVLCIGSINIDHYYALPGLPEEGRLVITTDYQRCLGGKGLNQVLALRAAGYDNIMFGGAIGRDGDWIAEELDRLLPDAHVIVRKEGRTGHVNILQVPQRGVLNSVILFHGANSLITREDILKWIECSQCQVLLIQNEIACTPELIQIARERGLRVVFNSAPVHVKDRMFWEGLGVEVLVVNRPEGVSLYELLIEGSSTSASHKDILVSLQGYTQCQLIIMTADKDGVYSIHRDYEGVHHIPAFDVELVDPTGAGDCFVGYFVAEYLSKGANHDRADIERCITVGQAAAAECCLGRGVTSVMIGRERMERRMCQVK